MERVGQLLHEVQALAAPEWAQTVSAVAAAVAAIAALVTVRHLRAQTRAAQDALEAQTRPFIANVPKGLYRERAEASGRDPADVSLGTYSTPRSDRPAFGASVPIRNVGNGAALIESVEFEVGGDVVEASAETLVLPPGELTRVGFMVEDGDEGARAAEAIAAVLEDFAVTIAFSDAAGHHRDETRLEVRNGQYPHVKARSLLPSALGRASGD